jgi:hypothetical protein
MSVELNVKDIRTTVLNYDLYLKQRAGLLRDFFRFRGQPRSFSNPAALGDCFFYDLHITHYVDRWGPHPPPPHPGFFEDFFPMILGRLVGPQNKLMLHISSSDPDYFDELSVANEILSPRNLAHVLLPSPPSPGGETIQAEVGDLVFEWPTDSLEYIVDQWFMSPQVTVEGYIGEKSVLEQIAKLYAQEDTEERIRRLLEKIEIGFKVWPDNNGLFVLTDKFDIGALRERLGIAELNHALQEAQSRYKSKS